MHTLPDNKRGLDLPEILSAETFRNAAKTKDAMRREFYSRFKHLWAEYEYYLNAWKKATENDK